jgi:hypothetical protein
MADQRIAAARASATGTGTHETSRAEAREAADGVRS